MTKRKTHTHSPAKNFPAPMAPKVLHQSAENLLPVISFLLVFVTVLAFWQVGRCGFINYDDVYCVTENSHVRHGAT